MSVFVVLRLVWIKMSPGKNYVSMHANITVVSAPLCMGGETKATFPKELFEKAGKVLCRARQG